MPNAPKRHNPSLDTKHAKEHMATYGIATFASLCRQVTEHDQTRASAIVASLVDSAKWRRCCYRKGGERVEYFSPDGAPLDTPTLRSRLATLQFCCCQDQPRPALVRPALTDLVKSVMTKAKLSLPDSGLCYVHQANKREPRRLSLIRVCPKGKLERSIEEIDALVSSREFALWRYVAMGNAFVLTYLWPGSQAEACELSRWIRRRVPLSRLGPDPTPIPVWVYAVPKADL